MWKHKHFNVQSDTCADLAWCSISGAHLSIYSFFTEKPTNIYIENLRGLETKQHLTLTTGVISLKHCKFLKPQKYLIICMIPIFSQEAKLTSRKHH